MQVSLIWIPCPSEQPWKPRLAMHSYETRGGGPREASTIVVVLVVMVVVVVMTIIAVGRDPLSSFCPPCTLSVPAFLSFYVSLLLSLCLSVSLSLNPSVPQYPCPSIFLSRLYLTSSLSVCLSISPSVSLFLSISLTFICLSYPHAQPPALVLDLWVARAISAVSRWLRGPSRLSASGCAALLPSTFG